MTSVPPTVAAGLALAAVLAALAPDPYPIDGYGRTGIRRLERQRLIADGTLPGTKPPPGALLGWRQIRLHRVSPGTPPVDLDRADPDLQRRVEALFRSRDPNYGFVLVDITPGRDARVARVQSERRFMPGSVGKLTIVAGLFAELKRLFPGDEEARLALLRSRVVRGGRWVVPNSHTVPVYDPQTKAFRSRTVQETDEFTLFEWADHMISASSNAAASVVWKEVMLLRHFGSAYPPSPAAEQAFFAETRKSELTELAVDVVNTPLRNAGIPEEDWRLGTMFTRGATAVVPGSSSYGTARGFARYLLALEEGRVVDPFSSLEIKRLMYQTQRRIRYASSPALADAAVYFKSGSQYRCRAEEGFECGQYRGNVENYMNSVATVETGDGRVYLVAVMSNVLRVNSATDHQALATQVERLLAPPR